MDSHGRVNQVQKAVCNLLSILSRLFNKMWKKSLLLGGTHSGGIPNLDVRCWLRPAAFAMLVRCVSGGLASEI